MLAGHYHPQIKMAAAGRKFRFMQDRASSHYSKNTVRWLDRNMQGWIKEWPAKGGDLNPLDFGIWSTIQQKVWDDEPKTRQELQACVMKHIVFARKMGVACISLIFHILKF